MSGWLWKMSFSLTFAPPFVYLFHGSRFCVILQKVVKIPYEETPNLLSHS
jgi:hypothetical protein